MNTNRIFLNRTARLGLAALVVLTALLTSTTPASAAGITVVMDSHLDTVQMNGDCSLSEAVLAANTDSPVDACPAGSGADTITFGVSGWISLVSSLPEVTSTITIDGTGQNITISGDNFTQVMQNSGTLHLIALTIADGNHIAGGGGINNDGTLTVFNSTFSGNSGMVAGGGIYNNGTLTVINSTFSDNSTQGRGGIGGDGGGIYNSGTLTVINSTFSGNSAVSGGGIFNATVFGGNAHLSNTIIANSPSGGDCVSEGNLATNVNNLIEDGSCNSALSGDPMLGPFRNNGGDTHTMALLPGSVAIDAGNDAVCAAAPVNNLDQRGATRPIDGDATLGAVCDIGAYEAAEVTVPTVTINQASGQADPTSASPIVFDVVFSEAVTDFDDAADVDLSLSTAPAPLSATITPVDARNYTVSVSGMTGSGTVVASIPANAVVGAANNSNAASTSTDNTVTFMASAPALTCTGQTATIYVNDQGTIVGGPNHGQAYKGKLTGTNGADVIVGTNGKDTIDGKASNDIICGGNGNDVIEGGAGSDQLFGEAGQDNLKGEGGGDTLTGGSQADQFRGGGGTDTATDFNLDEQDTKSSVEIF